MLARFRQLDPTGRWAVQVASLGEGHLAHRLLIQAAVDAGKPEEVESALDAATAAGLLRYHANDRSFSFSHALLRQAADETLAPSERARIHQRWAEVLTDPRNHDQSPHLMISAALHWAATDYDTETFTSTLSAAKVTNRLGALQETADLLVRAFLLWDRVPDPELLAGLDRYSLLYDTVHALLVLSRSSEVVALLDRELASIEPATANRTLLHALRMTRDDEAFEQGLEPDELLHENALQDAESLLKATATRPALAALLYLGWYVRWDDPKLSHRMHHRALQMSRQLGHAELAFVTNSVAGQLSGRGHSDQAIAVCDEGLQHASGLTDVLELETTRGAALHQAGRFTEAATQLERALARIPDPTLAPAEWAYLALTSGEPHFALGNWDRIAELHNRCAELDPDEWSTQLALAAGRALFACARGDLALAKERAAWSYAQVDPDPIPALLGLTAEPLSAAAEVAAAEGRYADALNILQPLLRQPGMDTYCQLWDPILRAARIAAAQAASGTTPDPEHVSLIETAVATLPTLGPFSAARHAHAVADLARAQSADTPEMWRAAAAGWRAVGHVPFLGEAHLRLADVLTRSGGRHHASEPLAEAWQVAARLGAAPLRDEVIDLARRAHVTLDTGIDEAAPPSGPLTRLTERELEVLRHIALGESNDEIGAALFISPRTASVHVSRILAKLDVTSRAKATALAYEHGVLG